MFYSCQDQTEENLVYKPTPVNEPPKALVGNKSLVYVTAEDVLNVEYSGLYSYRTYNYYEDDYGNSTRVYNNVTTDLYKIKAARYYGWDEKKEYISTFKEEYEINAQAFSDIRKRVNDAGFAICWRQIASDGEDHLGLGLIISGVY